MPKLFPSVKGFLSDLDPRRKAAKIRGMTDTPIPPDGKPKPGSQAELRRRRQAEALRANLSRRKQQDRGRADSDDAAVDDSTGCGLHGAETDGKTGG
ncbi:protein of unknown function [Magnetospirillum gryphiswaldense MSR-1 v2]|uniref:Uncharacterized protein n=2 Tax=Magnetospirillum gryphiswaldense TaxID=55518 RepID=V6EW91_MAGGM|nr:protein of unknown function [Magnetospirillum gryphiswaldense MSR-1 v2]